MKKTLENHLLSKQEAQKDYQADWNAHRYLIRGKMFAMHGGDKNGKEILTLKLLPEHGEEARELHNGKIIPGYYMNKTHWNSIYLSENISDNLVKKMIDESYELIVSGFSKKIQKEIAQGE
ncbi:MmcQ/YjbR family DNA-binding protein [Lactococcus nasutitermitis]|uniref:MmcQ/YjbR family DNA-binding protein n=1 Tax=Lactococcus nasutitermitis TaxID=1652957 RepID=A0ABV9JFR3_9LACT|nr:MmcQ/YjbR family DNA-binding protein [Lactococcus nasutitermitis]